MAGTEEWKGKMTDEKAGEVTGTGSVRSSRLLTHEKLLEGRMGSGLGFNIPPPPPHLDRPSGRRRKAVKPLRK